MPSKAFNFTKGVLSFNGRKGNVIPKDGDYTADQVGASNKELSNLSDYQKALRNIGGRPNRNILNNSYMMGGSTSGAFPINQRGQTTYTSGYTIDGWYLSGGTLSINNDYIELEAPSDNFATFKFSVESPSKYEGKTLTLSTIAEKVSGTEYCYITNIFDTYKLDTAISNKKSIYTLTDIATTLTSSLAFVFVCGKGCKIRIYAAKLEEGDKQSLAYQDSNGAWQLFETPDYEEELIRCQRYYQDFEVVFADYAYEAGKSRMQLLKIPTMRTIPAVEIEASELVNVATALCTASGKDFVTCCINPSSIGNFSAKFHFKVSAEL